MPLGGGGSEADSSWLELRADAAPIELPAVAMAGPALGALPASTAAQDGKPWRLEDATGAPEWLTLKGHLRTRYEALNEQYRAGLSGSDGYFTSRAAIAATARYERYAGTLEIMDARVYGEDDDTPLGTGEVNALDLLQLLVRARYEDTIHEGDTLDVTVGRQTKDLGSRRFLARNRYRNTVNSYTGVNADWTSASGTRVDTFYYIPVRRLPRDAASLQDNDFELDEERSQVRFYGVHVTQPKVAGPFDGEVFVFGLDEEDGDELNTRNRDLWTFGFRLRKKPTKSEFDYELEAAYQTGDSRASSSAADTTDLDHKAEFVHFSTGYLFDVPTAPRLEFLFDYASGDDDPNDGENNRFDSLFGVPRFEYGPTNLYRAFTRENVLSPGLRLNLKPTESTQLMIADRNYYLASDRDAWVASGLVDPTGQSGDFLGNQLELRLRWDVTPNLRVETGMARLWAGSFVDNAPNATTQGDTTYGYLSTNLTF